MSNIYYGGSYVPAYHFGFWSGYSLAWASPAWYYYTPFHPAFYWAPPVYYDGGVYPGGFDWGRFFVGLILWIVAIWVMVWLFRRLFAGGGRRIRYTSYS